MEPPPPKEFHALQAFSAPQELYALPTEERRAAIKKLGLKRQTLCCWVKCFDGNPSRNVLRKLTKSTGPEGFPPKSLTSQACGHYMKVVKGFLKLVCHLPEADAFMVP